MGTKVIVPETLGEISDLAVNGYSLNEILTEELGLSSDLVDDDEVIEAFNAGLIHIFINKKVDVIPDEYIIQDTHITQAQCNEWGVEYYEAIKLQRMEINEDTRTEAREMVHSIDSGIKTFTMQAKQIDTHTGKQALKEEVSNMVQRLKSGNIDDLLSVLVVQNMQLNKLNERISRTVSNSDRYDIMSKFSNIQLKIMNDTRKNIMSINEIINPKRTTFVKNATQHNHTHSLSEKKEDMPNELSQPKGEIIDAHQYTEAETVTEGTDK